VTTAPPSSSTAQGRTPRAAQGVDGELGAGAEHLLVVAEREVDVAGGREAVGEQPLDRLDHGDQGALVVDGAASVHDPVVDAAGERVVLPVLPLDRDDVVVRHQHQRLGLARAAPAQQQRSVAEHLDVELGEGPRVERGELLAELHERGVVDLAGLARGDGRDPHQPGQPLGRRDAVVVVAAVVDGLEHRWPEPRDAGRCGGHADGGRRRQAPPHTGVRSASGTASARSAKASFGTTSSAAAATSAVTPQMVHTAM
jgi:hypothetical protein